MIEQQNATDNFAKESHHAKPRLTSVFYWSLLILVPSGSCRIALLNHRWVGLGGSLHPLRDWCRCHPPRSLLLDLTLCPVLSCSRVPPSGHCPLLVVV